MHKVFSVDKLKPWIEFNEKFGRREWAIVLQIEVQGHLEWQVQNILDH